MYTLGGEYPESPAESEESVTDESPDNEGTFSQVASPYGGGSSSTSGGGRGTGRGFTSRRESTAEKQRKWAVRTFTLWLTSEGITKPIDDMVSQELNQLLKKFYKEARRKDGCDFSKPGLTNIRNALDRFIKSKLNFSILKTSEFTEANKAFDEKVSLIEGNAASPWRHSVSISPQDMQKMLLSGAISGANPLPLLRASWFNILLHFDVGDHLKQRRLSKQQFVVHIDASGHEHIKMINCFPYDQSKFGMTGNTSSATTMHPVPGHPLCPVALLKKYLSKLHPESDALFQCPVQYSVDNSVPVWYEKQAVGVHALEGMMTCLSKEAGLSRVYSNGCLRKSSSLVYLQCGFGVSPNDLTIATTASTTINNSTPSTSGISSFVQGSSNCVPQMSALPGPSSNDQARCSFPPDSKQHLQTFSTYSPSSPHSVSLGNPTFLQVSNPISLAKPDNYQSSKLSSQASHHDAGSSGQSRTAIGVCMPTIKIEEGGSHTCEGTTMGVQPTFPSESIDFPSVTEAMTVRREMRYTTGMHNRQSSASSSSLPLNVQNKTYLHVAVLKGKSFVEFEQYQQNPEQQEAPTLTLHVHFRGQRLKSMPIACTSEPDLKDLGFLLELHHSPSVDIDTLLSITDPINLVLSKTETTGSVSLIGSHSFEWQKVLKEANGVLVVTVDINGMGEEAKMMIGALEMRFQISTNGRQAVSPQAIESQLSAVHSQISERERRFMGYARQWWKNYISGPQSHSRQQVKIFAQNECGINKPVVSYISPIQTGWLLDNPMHAAKFVSLLKHEEECSMFGSKVDTWSSPHAFLCRGKGSCEDHAILLCCIFLGFGLDAFVCLGTKDTGQQHIWVMTKRIDGQVTFWESLTGQRFESADSPQYRTIGCIFNNSAFYANIQESGLVSQCNFDIHDTSKWRAMDADAIYAVCGSEIKPPLPVPPCLIPSTIDRQLASSTLEAALKNLIEKHRQDLSLSTTWDVSLPHCLSPWLAAQEHEARTGLMQNIEELQEPVSRYLARKFSFYSITTCLNHAKPPQVFSEILTEYELLLDYKEDVEFALRVHVVPYPETACAVWIVLAAKLSVNDSKITNEWKVVKLLQPELSTYTKTTFPW